jgi:hypothetical protein
MAGQPLQLQRTTYRDPNTGQVRPGGPTCGESALDMEQYYQPLERFHASSLHDCGVAAGLRVTATLNSSGVTVLPGIALDSNGMHIFLISGEQAEISKDTPGTTPLVPVTDGGVAIPTDGQTNDQYLVIQFWETFDSQAQDNGIFRYTHTPWLHFVDAAHLAHDGSSIILAKVSFGTGATAGQVTALEDMRQRADWHVERTHEASIHGAGVAAGLDVMVTLNTAGVTVLPGIALDGNGQYLSLASGGQAEIGPNADAPGATPTLVPIADTGVVVPTTGLNSDKYLTIQFWETATGETLAPTLQSVAPFHFVHTPWLRLLDVAGFMNDGTRIILAKVSFGTGANAGLVADLAVDQRQETSLAVGSISLQRGITASPATGSKAINNAEAGIIRAYPAGGLDITAPNPTDEIHMEQENGHNVAKISLGAQTIVARRNDGTESVTVDTQSGNVASTSISADTSVRQNRLYLSGGVGWSSLTYNAHHNDANNQWVFPDPSHPAVTVEMDDSSGAPRFQVWNTPTWNTTGWVERFAIDGNSGNVLMGQNGGNVGIGTTSPSNQFVNTSQASFGGNTRNTGTEPVEVQGPGAGVSFYDRTGGATGRWVIYSDRTGGAGTETLRIWSADDKVAITQAGNMGIGTTTPQSSLEVRGDITTPWGVTFQHNEPGWGGNQFKPYLRRAWDGSQGDFLYVGATGNRPNTDQMAMVLSQVQGIKFGTGTDNAGGLNSEFMRLTPAGSVNISKDLQVNGRKSFKMDHPLYPDRKYLFHSSIESPDMKNMYDGVVVLDANGEAVVELPQWFQALNKDLRYQLTCIGGYAPVYIAEKVNDNRFKIAGGKPEMEVSWQVTGIRQDAWARAHPLAVEEDKPAEEQGYYLHPELYGAPEEKHISAARYSETVK